MFLPFPAYLISSLSRSKSKLSVGSSRGSVTATIFPDEVLRVAGRGALDVVGATDAVVDGSDGQNARSNSKSASPPSAARAATCVRFSVPSFIYAPDRR
jgi:hypothetical protein